MSISHKECEDLVTALYRGVLDRDPDADGLAHWVNLLQSGRSLRDVCMALMSSDEAQIKEQLRTRLHDTSELDQRFANILQSLMEEKLTIVDIGAQNLASEKHVYHRLNSCNLVKNIVCFEPIIEKAIERERSDPLAIVHTTALGDGNEQMLHINNVDATSSLLPINQEIMGSTEHLYSLKTKYIEKIKTTRLDDIELPDQVDLLKLDIQGYEFNVLEHGLNTLKRTLAIYSELEIQPIYKEQKLVGDMICLLDENEFQLHDLYNQVRLSSVNFRAASPNLRGSALYWTDGLFFKKTNYLDTQELIKQAAIAHYLYSSYDKCYDNLTLVDTRENTNFAQKYLDIVNL
ncbi:MAG: FkbM family methyltransferase [Rhizobiaceae bacterium]|nr:FkbM family methyltransferase [Rhizobiaceae bacterium]